MEIQAGSRRRWAPSGKSAADRARLPVAARDAYVLLRRSRADRENHAYRACRWIAAGSPCQIAIAVGLSVCFLSDTSHYGARLYRWPLDATPKLSNSFVFSKHTTAIRRALTPSGSTSLRAPTARNNNNSRQLPPFPASPRH